MTSEEAAIAGAAGVSVAMILVLALVWWVVLIIARWKIYTKAGEAGWKSIIPVYADYVQWRIGWKKTNMFWIAIALVVIGYVLAIASGAVAIGDKGKLVAGMGDGGFLAIIAVICMIAACVINLMAIYKLFASFGKGAGWFILSILFPHIMLLVLGFGSSQHIGAQD